MASKLFARSCSIHFCSANVKKRKLMKFSDARAATCKECADVWLMHGDPASEEGAIARQFWDSQSAATEIYYHQPVDQHCYLKFTSRKRLPQTETGPSPKKLRSESTSRPTSAFKNLFPNLCIICGKETKWIRVGGCWKRDRLAKVS